MTANTLFEEGVKLAGNLRKEHGGNIPSDITDMLNNLLQKLTNTYDTAARRALEQNPTIKMQTASSLYSRARKFEGPNGTLSGTNEQPFPDLQKLSTIA